MSEVALREMPQQAFTEKAEELAKISARRGRATVAWNSFWAFAIATLYSYASESTILQFIAFAVMALVPFVALFRLVQIKRSPFRRITANRKNFSNRPEPFVAMISGMWLLILISAIERRYEDIVLYFCFLLFVFWPPVWWLRYQRRTLELLPDKITHRWQWKEKKKGGKEKEQVNEIAIPYADIMRVESPGFRNLHAYYFCGDTYTYLPIDERDFGVGALASTLKAIEEHAPQAKFDDEADLMRRGYFSW
jgi:hypothetical protein